MNSRAQAAIALKAVLEEGRSLNDVLPGFRSKFKNPQDFQFFQGLTFGTLRFYPRLEFIINLCLKTPLKKAETLVFYLLAVGLYQLMETRIPHHAALNETVEAARELKKSWGCSLINAVLHKFLREKDLFESKLQKNPEAAFAHPKWLLEKIQKDWPSHWQDIIENNNTPPTLSLRVNLRKCSREDYLDELEKAEIQADIIPETKAGIILFESRDITTLPHFEQGYFSVQDSAAQFAAPLLLLSKGMRVLDVCAAPGGKTAHMLESEPDLKEVVAIDISKSRAELIKDNLKRLELSTRAKVLTEDACHPEKWWDKKQFDRILVDAPCSGTGVIARHPDIKYLRRPSDLPKLVLTQLELLNAIWPLLKPDGLLVYATCSILMMENEKVIEKFLSCQTNARLDTFDLPVGIKLKSGHMLLPLQNNRDGFYYARLRKYDGRE